VEATPLENGDGRETARERALAMFADPRARKREDRRRRWVTIRAMRREDQRRRQKQAMAHRLAEAAPLLVVTP
jgi:hypothetical protein